ncbi:MAG: saccharopine dehydrogenase NADP-binding domain-containing protein [Acidobacteriota bacterium]
MTEHDRSYDLVLFGATGFTGRLTAEYLAHSTHEGAPLRWAIAGRSRDKLERVAADVAKLAADGVEPAVEVADVGDRASLDALAASTRVLATTVGPYALHGRGVVEACVDAATDYLDITGEPEFVAGTVRDHDAKARAQGIRVVSCCGFDSIPHDVGAWLTVRELPSDRPIRVEGFVHGVGEVSGGTWQSAVQAFGRLNKSVRATSGPRADGGRRVRGAKPTIRYEKRLRNWVAPLPTIDPWIVLRSAAALDEYGPDFRYGHSIRVRSLPRLAAGVGAVGGIVALSQLGPTRRWLLSLKGSGDGPSAERRERSRFNVTFFGEALGDDGKPTDSTVVEVSGGDPGYGETSKMLAESALSLVHDRDRLPDAAGVITPVVALGDALVDRQRAAEMRFEVIDTRKH